MSHVDKFNGEGLTVILRGWAFLNECQQKKHCHILPILTETAIIPSVSTFRTFDSNRNGTQFIVALTFRGTEGLGQGKMKARKPPSTCRHTQPPHPGNQIHPVLQVVLVVFWLCSNLLRRIPFVAVRLQWLLAEAFRARERRVPSAT